MKKAVLFLLLSGLSTPIWAQSEKIKTQLRQQKIENDNKLEKFIQKNEDKFSDLEIKKMKATLAGFAGEQPIFWKEDDKPANRSAGMTPLQEGTLSGLENIPIEGTGINILVMDGGRALSTHDQFGGTAGASKVVNMEATSVDYSSHATAVTGFIMALGNGTGSVNFSDGTSYAVSDSQGVLPNATSKNYSFEDTDLGTNYEKLAAATTANISNHSYGINLGWSEEDDGYYWYGNYDLGPEDTYSGSYYTPDQSFDKIVYSNPNHIVIKSAGNYYGVGPTSTSTKTKYKYNSLLNTYTPFSSKDEIPPVNCSEGYNCIGWGSLAKNIIVVGATNQLSTTDNLYTSSTDVTKADFSSAGPRKDGAIKPDISAVGVDMFAPTYSSDNSNSTSYYTKGSGTSFSAPIVAGVAGALTQIERNLTGNSSFIFKADEMKALLTHTANEAGNPGPDVWFGWGFVNATNGAELLIDKAAGTAFFERQTLTSAVKFTKEIVAQDGVPLKASLSWIDPAATPFTTDEDLKDNHTSRLVNDLDLRIIDTTDGTVYYPWKLNIDNPMDNATKGDNLVDNIEQVVIDSPVAGRTYKVEVSNKNTLVNDKNAASTQDYALIITGYGSDLAVDDVDALKSVAVYPTRTKDYVTVVVPVKADKISVYDMAGKQLLNVNAKSEQMIDFSSFSKGVYIIMIKTENGTKTQKIIKE